MKGWVTCPKCRGVCKKYKWLLFPISCSYCDGMGDIWVKDIDEYYKNEI